MELKITKEKVLEAASKCSTAKATLQTLFPEAFEDGIAIKPGVFDSSHDPGLADFSLKAFGHKYAIQIADGAVVDESHRLRSLFLHSNYTVETMPALHGAGTIIVIKKK